MLNVTLVVVGGDAKAAEIRLKLPTTIGRGRDSGLTLPHPLVSRQHCEIFELDGNLFVRDMKSLNGTYVDNKRIKETEPLQPNQLLTIGNVTFRAVYGLGEDADLDTETQLQAETVGDHPSPNVVEFENDVASNGQSDQEVDSLSTHPKWKPIRSSCGRGERSCHYRNAFDSGND